MEAGGEGGLSPGTVTLIGSGEMAGTMAKVHRAVMAEIEGAVHPVFVDTPAGFQLNADELAARAVEYFRRHLNLGLEIVSFKAADTASSQEVAEALRRLQWANYIFAGPGSPTYAARNWRGTPIAAAMAQRLAAGAHIVFASAASITLGRYVIPVYEIYKVGERPRWVEGLDLLGPYGMELAVVPHWNNAEGGTHDTRYCFMGEPRFRYLETQLPASATVLGVDEYTACIIDLKRDEGRVMGAGQVTIRRGGREVHYPAPAVFPLAELRGGAWEGEVVELPPLRVSKEVEELAQRPSPDEIVAPFIELLVWVRAQLRADRQWALADEIRKRLSELGVVLEDRPEGTTWRSKTR